MSAAVEKLYRRVQSRAIPSGFEDAVPGFTPAPCCWRSRRPIDRRTRAEFPEIPFAKIVGMRNRVVHDYGQVDFEIVWETVERHLPLLLEQLERFFLARGEA